MKTTMELVRTKFAVRTRDEHSLGKPHNHNLDDIFEQVGIYNRRKLRTFSDLAREFGHITSTS